MSGMQCNKGDGINVYERKNKATLSETTSNTVCTDDSNSTNGSPSGLFDKKREEYVYYFDLGESLYKLIFRTVILFVNASLLDLDHDANVAFGLLCSMSNEV